MKVKFVYNGTASPGSEVTIDMKSLPHVGDRLRLADGSTVEITTITHTPEDKEFAALAIIRSAE